MDYKNDWINSCFSSAKPERLALVKRSDNDYIGPYSLDVAKMVSADLGGADIIDSETGELLNA